MAEKLYTCPNCDETWSILEVQEQECFECGYPNHDKHTGNGDINAGLVPEQCDTGRGLTPFLRHILPNQYNMFPAEMRYSSKFQHSLSGT